MPWLILVVAGLFEVAWVSLLGETKGFTRVVPTIGFLLTLAISMFLLDVATRTIPIGTGYAVWVVLASGRNRTDITATGHSPKSGHRPRPSRLHNWTVVGQYPSSIGASIGASMALPVVSIVNHTSPMPWPLVSPGAVSAA